MASSRDGFESHRRERRQKIHGRQVEQDFLRGLRRLAWLQGRTPLNHALEKGNFDSFAEKKRIPDIRAHGAFNLRMATIVPD